MKVRSVQELWFQCDGANGDLPGIKERDGKSPRHGPDAGFAQQSAFKLNTGWFTLSIISVDTDAFVSQAVH
jgi:hypothetical protein